MNIQLHIDRLVLEGINLSHDQQRLLQTAVINELTRLLRNGGLPPQLVKGITLDRMSAGSIQMTDNKPDQLGLQIAQSVYGGLSRE